MQKNAFERLPYISAQLAITVMLLAIIFPLKVINPWLIQKLKIQ
jgi:hypothetical protein